MATVRITDELARKIDDNREALAREAKLMSLSREQAVAILVQDGLDRLKQAQQTS